MSMTNQESADKGQPRTPVAVYYGSVPAFEPSFKDGEFRPFNPAYSSFMPSPDPVDGPYGAVLEIFEGEWFNVEAAWSVHDAGLPTNFLHYPDAYRRSLRAGEQGGTAYVSIQAPYEPLTVTAVDAEGNQVPVFSQTRHLGTRLARRLVFPNR